MKKQDFIKYLEQNNLTISELSKKIGIAHRTLDLFLNTSSSRKKKVMFKLKKFYDDNISTQQQLNLVEPVKDEQEEKCEYNINPRDARIALEVSLQILKAQNVIAEDTFHNLMTYVSIMEQGV